MSATKFLWAGFVCFAIAGFSTAPAAAQRIIYRSSAVVPANATVVPANTTVVPANTKVVPANSKVVPANSKVVPANSKVVPANSKVVPANSKVVPANSTVVPANTKVVPANTKVVPANTKVVPANAKVVRSTPTVVPAAPSVVKAGTVVSNPTGQVCPQCGKIHGQPQPAKSSFQAEAESEARSMASRGYKGHVRGTIPGVRFCGVGWSSSSSNAPTCRPSGNMTLVADAVARGSDGWYRVRYWR